MNKLTEALKQVRTYVALALGAGLMFAAELGVDVIDVCEEATVQVEVSQ